MKIFRLATAPIKIHQIPHVISGTKRQFFFKLFITFQSHETTLLYFFILKLYMLWIYFICFESANFQTFDCSHENWPCFLCHFSSHKSVFLQIFHHFSVSWHINPMKSSSWNICFGQKEPIKIQFFRLLSALMKVHQIPHGIFETTR